VDESKELLEAIKNAINSDREKCQKLYTTCEESEEMHAFVEAMYNNVSEIGGSMAKYWLSFMYMVDILMQNIHALRTQNWTEFLTSFRLMLPWLRIYDNDKYAKWLLQF
jgi:hypothetical protein